MSVLETERLSLRELGPDDAAFILALLNEPPFLRFIGDRKVRTLADARGYIESGPVASYRRHGFGLYLVERKDGLVPVGICGLLQRDSLPDPDIGFAFRQEHWSQGYAGESAGAVLDHARTVLGLARILAVVDPDNARSIRVLTRLGMGFERTITWADDGHELALYATGA